MLNKLAASAILLVLFSCSKRDSDGVLLPPVDELMVDQYSPNLPQETFAYSELEFPDSFMTVALSFFDNTPSNNPVTDEGATLGRVLFYDKKLSLDNTIACGSCHQQSRAFSDPAQFSLGINSTATTRNSMSLVNIQFHNRMFWDGRTFSLENQVLEPISHPGEMNLPLEDLAPKLAAIEYYPPLFESAFGTADITSENVSRALAQFIRSLRSFSSPYDQGVENEFSNFSAQELEGKNVFFGERGDCNGCHFTSNFMVNSPINNGLDLVYEDQGQGGFTGNESDFGQFKVPSLRNIEVTAPYMHDGRFSTLAEVVEHYSSGLQAHPNLDDRLTTTMTVGGPPDLRNLTQDEKAALIAFLHTLSDEYFLSEEAYSNPFIP